MKSTSASIIARETTLLLLGLPAWWYGIAAWRGLQMLTENVSGNRQVFQLKLFFRDIFKPLYGADANWEMRLVSVVVRVPLTVLFTVWVCATIAAVVLMFLAWLLLPFIVIAAIIHQFVPLL